MQLCKYFYTLQILFVHELYGWEGFRRGRREGGNVGSPGGENACCGDGDFEWFTQALDHTNPSDTRTWQQRYLTNNQFYSAGGPVFLMIGGEGKIDESWMQYGAWIQYATQYRALYFQVEHRYYGESHPTPDLSTENLKFLSSEQALADLAVFITSMNAKYTLPSEVKWIVFGGSYAGNLAAWMRLKYPNLVHGAVSSSGPLLAKVDFDEYFAIVADSLRTYSDDCVSAIQEATSELQGLLRDPDGQQSIRKMFQLCSPTDLNNPNDVSAFYMSIADVFAYIVQYNSNTRNTEEGDISRVCKRMTNRQLGSPLARLAAVYTMKLITEQCLNTQYSELIELLRNTEYSEGSRQWTYQTCSEFGFYQTSSHVPQVFGSSFPVSYYIQECADIFGPEFTLEFINNAAAKTNSNYKGLNINVSNVVYVHGSIDPWHALGPTHAVNPNAPVIYVEGASHCASMYADHLDDLPDLTAAKAKVGQYIGNWIRS